MLFGEWVLAYMTAKDWFDLYIDPVSNKCVLPFLSSLDHAVVEKYSALKEEEWKVGRKPLVETEDWLGLSPLYCASAGESDAAIRFY